MKNISSWCCLILLLAAAWGQAEPAVQARATEPFAIDGKLERDCWEKALWYPLNHCYPDYASADMTGNKIMGAMLWSGEGLYVGIKAEDEDVQANKTVKNDWIWLDDVCEVFMSPLPQDNRHPYLELQVSANGTVFEDFYRGNGEFGKVSIKTAESIPRYQVAVNIEGSLNNSKAKDRGWSAEWFVSWAELKRVGLVAKDFQPRAGASPLCLRLANWNITIYTPCRVFRFIGSDPDPHNPLTYSPLTLISARP